MFDRYIENKEVIDKKLLLELVLSLEMQIFSVLLS